MIVSVVSHERAGYAAGAGWAAILPAVFPAFRPGLEPIAEDPGGIGVIR